MAPKMVNSRGSRVAPSMNSDSEEDEIRESNVFIEVIPRWESYLVKLYLNL